MTKVPFGAAVLAAVAVLSASSLASASNEKVLYSFPSESTVFGQVQEDSLGNLYGTTYLEDGSGTVYELSEHHGNWNRRIVHVFGSDSDGASPHAGLNSDHIDGTFYGTTTSG